MRIVRYFVKRRFKMAKSSRKNFYAVSRGRTPGIYSSWEECKAQVHGVSSSYKGFATLSEALSFLKNSNNLPDSTIQSVIDSHNVASSSSTPINTTTSINIILSPDAKEKIITTTITSTIPIPQPSFIPSSTSNAASSSLETQHILKKTSKAKRVVTDESETYEHVYIDGACSNNGKDSASAGLGVWWGTNDSRNLSERVTGEQTNNRGELLAAIRVLETTDNEKDLLIHTDSKYVKDGIDGWVNTWRRNNWKTSNKGQVKNVDLWQRLDNLVRTWNGKLVFKHVPAHVGIIGNEGADQLAVQGAML